MLFPRLSKLFQRDLSVLLSSALPAACSLILRCPGVRTPKYTCGPSLVNKVAATKALSEKRKTIPSPPLTWISGENSSASGVTDKMDDARGDGHCSAGVPRQRNVLCLYWSRAGNGSSCSKTNDAAVVNSHGWLAAGQQEFTECFFSTRQASDFFISFSLVSWCKKTPQIQDLSIAFFANI